MLQSRLAGICRSALITLVLAPMVLGVAKACSGPGAAELIEHNRSVVNIYGSVAIVGLLGTIGLYVARRRKGLLVILVSLVVGFFHPFWYYGGGGGDCGRTMVERAQYVTIALVVLIMLQIVLWRVRRPVHRT